MRLLLMAGLALKEIHMRKLIAVLFLIAPLTAACNTVQGAGKDIEKVGDHIEDRAEQAKH
jgi:predicted small secreted protein